MSKTITEIVDFAGGAALVVAGVLTANPYLVVAGAGMVMSGIGTMLSKGPLSGMATTSRNPIAPWEVIYGRAHTGGTVVFINSFGDNDKYLDLVIVLASHPCQSVDALLFDQQRILLGGPNGTTPYGAWYMSKPASDFFHDITINTISRPANSNVVTCTINGDIPELQDGDDIIIHDCHPVADLFNGKFSVRVMSRTPGTSLTFTYLSGGPAATVTGSGSAQTAWADYKQKVYIEWMLGNQPVGATFQGMINGTPYDGNTSDLQTNSSNPWTADCSLAGKTCVFLRLHYNDQVFSGGLPQISFIVSGKNDIYDPRSGTNGYTSNAALCIADYLSNTTIGFKAAYGTEIPASPLIAAANICDEIVTLAEPHSPPLTELRYTCNGKFPVTMKRGEVLQNMLTSCAGRLTYTGGQFIIWPAAWMGATASSPPSSPPITIVQQAPHVAGESSISTAFPNAVLAGNTIIVVAQKGGTDPLANVTCFDSQDNPYRAYYLATEGGSAVFGAVVEESGYCNVTANRNPGLGGSPDIRLFAYEVSGLGTAWTVESSVNNDSEGLVNWNDPLSITTTAEDLILVAAWDFNGLTSGGYSPTNCTMLDEDTTPLGLAGTGAVGYAVQPAGTYSVGFTRASSWPWSNAAIAIKPGGVLSSGVTTELAPLPVAAGPFRWRSTVSISALYNGVKGTYISSINKWQPSDFPRYAQDTDHGYVSSPPVPFDDENLAADGGDRRWLDIQLPFTISCSMAQRLAKIELLRRRWMGTGTFLLNMTGYQFQPMDIIAMDLPYFSWSGKLLEVQASRLKFDRQGDAEAVLLGVEIDVQETDPSVYLWSTSEELSPQGFQQGIAPTGNVAPANATGLTLLSDATTALVGADGVARSRILATWSAPTDAFVLNGGHAELQYRVDSSPPGAWIALPTIAPDITSLYIDNVTDGVSYDVQLRFVNALGAPADWIQAGPCLVAGVDSSMYVINGQ